MKTLKRTFLLVAVAAMLMPLLDSCKKGSEDPGISFKSRNGRVTGTWTLKSYSITGTTDTTIAETNEVNDDTYDYHSKTNWSESYNGTSISASSHLEVEDTEITMWYNVTKWEDQEIEYVNEENSSYNRTFSFTISLYKDNTYETTETSGNASGESDYDWEIKFQDDNDPTAFDDDDKDDFDWSTTGSATSVTQGSWYWEDNTIKNKLFINAGMVTGQVIRLTSKEMWVEVQYAQLGGSGEETSDVGSDTQTRDILMNDHNDGNPLDESNGDEVTVTSWNNSEDIVMLVFEKTDKNSKRHKAK